MAIKGVIQREKISISATGAGTSELVAAVSGERIQILSLVLTSELDANIKIQSAATDLTGTIYIAARGGFVVSHQPYAVFETAASEAFNLYRTATGNFGGSIVYVQGEI